VTASLGVAQVLEDEGGDSLIMRADTALYLAKEHTRNCSFFHDGEQGHLFESIDEAEAPTEAVSEKEDVPEVETPQQLDLQTGLPNRKVFLKDTARRIAEWQRYKSPLSTISIVVDDYDRWIEERGEPARDVMLKIVTEFLQAAMRDMDVVARSGENLFAILLPGATMDHAVEVAERLRVAIARCTVQLAGSPLNVTISLGVAVATLDDEAESFLARSEAAAVGASETGGDAICVHDGEHCERIGVELEAIE
jgi:diguanylate cyclase